MHGVLHFDPDAARVQALGKGSRAERERALRDLMGAHATRLHRTATHILGDPAAAEDVVQETFLKAWSRAEGWRTGEAKFGTWLGRVTVNACLDRLRRNRPTAEMPEDVTDGALPADALLVREETSDRVRRAILALPERQRAALILSVYAEMGQREASETLGITEGAYESLLVRARRALRSQLGDER